jgi:hypothetical protein
MLLRMMDGQSHTAKALAAAAGLKQSAASAHLRHLVDARMVKVTVAGRHKLHMLASVEVANAIEALAAVSPLLPVESLRAAQIGTQLQIARACYSHLGGALAVAIADRFVTEGVIDPLVPGHVGDVYTLGHPILCALDIGRLPNGTAPAVRGCLDWTQGRPHTAGRLGSALLTALLQHRWLLRRHESRALTVTPLGYDQLDRLEVSLHAPAPTTH